MGDEKIKLTICGEEKEYEKGTQFIQIAQEYQNRYSDDIVLVAVNNRLRELHKKVKREGELTFITTKDVIGRKTYRRSVTLLMQKALYNLLGKEKSTVYVKHCISQAYYCELVQYGRPDEAFLQKLKEEMLKMAEEQIPIYKECIGTDEAVELFHRLGMPQKECLLRYRRSSKVNTYSLDGYRDYFYGYMTIHTGYLKYFDLQLFGDGFVLMFPNHNTKETAPFCPSEKYYATLSQSREWGRTLGVHTVGSLNNAIVSGKIREIILIQEALMEQRIGQIAEKIVSSGDIRFVMIAGPSSSGKTTFAHRLSIQLSALGLKPHPLSLDDYYLELEQTPKDENGRYNFECLEALDVELFNHDMSALLEKKAVGMPTFNFQKRKREYRGKEFQLGEGEILIIEGIHGLNPKLSYSLPEESKFKIFISALTQINIDEHNYLPTKDARLIRRIVRDARTRNTTAQQTIAMWESVRRGEENYIFPFQDAADVMFNSALIYELAVLKLYAEPLLFQIEKSTPEYGEAKRLLKFLDYFLPVSPEEIGRNSILREFIGGSTFHV